MDNFFVSVVMPTYNRIDLLHRALQAFSSQTFPFESFEVIVVDDGSTDQTPVFLTSEKFPFSLRFLRQNHGGAAKARNVGIRESRGSVVIFTDDDCVVSPQFLELHVKAHRVEGIVGRGPVVLVRNIDAAFDTKIKFKPAHFSMNFFCTSNASVRKDTLIKAGGFNEGFGRWEDAELGFRLRKLGLKMSFLFGAPVFHLKPVWKLENLIQTALSDGKGAAKLFKLHPCMRTWFASGLHPVSVGVGKLLKPWVDQKIARMVSSEQVEGIWERLIFHAYFVEGLGGGG